jgi:hypothetical protein
MLFFFAVVVPGSNVCASIGKYFLAEGSVAEVVAAGVGEGVRV